LLGEDAVVRIVLAEVLPGLVGPLFGCHLYLEEPSRRQRRSQLHEGSETRASRHRLDGDADDSRIASGVLGFTSSVGLGDSRSVQYFDRPMTTGNRAAPRGMVRSVMHLGLGQVATTVLTILLSAALARTLGPSDFGLLYLVTAIATFAYVV